MIWFSRLWIWRATVLLIINDRSTNHCPILSRLRCLVCVWQTLKSDNLLNLWGKGKTWISCDHQALFCASSISTVKSALMRFVVVRQARIGLPLDLVVTNLIDHFGVKWLCAKWVLYRLMFNKYNTATSTKRWNSNLQMAGNFRSQSADLLRLT